MVKSLKKGNYQFYYNNAGVPVRCASSYEVVFANFMLGDGCAQNFLYEPVKFTASDGGTYTPDFSAEYQLGSKIFYEVKGWDRCETQIKRREEFALAGNTLVMVDLDWLMRMPTSYQSFRKSKREADKMEMTVEDYLAGGYYIYGY